MKKQSLAKKIKLHKEYIKNFKKYLPMPKDYYDYHKKYLKETI